jgi:hypothetical protein
MLELSFVVYASDRVTGHEYRVRPISTNDALVKLTPISRETKEENGCPFRVLTGDLIEEYTLYDVNFNKL